MIQLSRKFILAALIMAIAAGFGTGIWYAQTELGASPDLLKRVINTDKGQPREIDFGLFWQVWAKLHEKYVGKGQIDNRKLVQGAIKGMVEGIGDPYTVYFEPSTSKKFQEEISGSFGGVGIELGKRNGVLTVIAPIKDSPAFKAGILAGDRILKIDNKPASDLAIEEAVDMIRGKRGTKVTLTVSHNGGSKDIELMRDTIKIPTIDLAFLNDGKIAYLRIYAFNQNVNSEFAKAAQQILQSKASRIILDLRNNPGGLLDSAINIAGWFIDKGQTVVIEDSGNGLTDRFLADGNAALKSYPVVILINGGSASASEILAGAIKDNRHVKLVGEKSFGKGSVQELVSFDDESSLKVTIAKWLTPDGISISEKGINADVIVKIDEKGLENGTLEIGKPGSDPQLDKAIELVD